MVDDIILNKVAIIERCIKRIRTEYNESGLEVNFTKQDSIILNLQRACEAAIDVGLRVIRLKKLGVPQNVRDVFLLLEQANLISKDLSKKLQAMVGFRNIAVHDYVNLNLDVVKSIVKNHLSDFTEFNVLVLKI